jgi:mRNA interferase MazF
MINIERGMVIDINLDPVQGSETGKVRPCVVVTNDIYNSIIKFFLEAKWHGFC